jgi:tRNA(adenine34) deaminase
MERFHLTRWGGVQRSALLYPAAGESQTRREVLTRAGFGDDERMADPHFLKDEYFMRLALRQAERATEHGDVPIGAVVVLDGEVIAAAGNERELRKSPVAHAEIIAIEEAAAVMGSWRLLNTVIYVTLEPCPMCAGAIVQARIPHLVYGATDEKAGAAGTLYNVCQDARLNHCLEITSGVLADESAAVLRQFFQARR